MGVFDHIVAKCPECGEELYGQTKAGDPSMRTYHIKDEMFAREAIVVDGEIIRCPNKHEYEVRSEGRSRIKVRLEKLGTFEDEEWRDE